MNKSTIYWGDVNKYLNDVIANLDCEQIFLLVDENTQRHCLPHLDLREFHVIKIPSGEAHKNIETCQAIWANLLDKKATRKALLINLGGGVIGDMGAFCAASFKRGIYFINIPTTLLAMVDASSGGKTGVDFMNQKNMIGLFVNPIATIIDPIFLQTLPTRHIQSGKAEMLKHGLIYNLQHFQHIQLEGIPDLDQIKESVNIKKHFVEADPFDHNLRQSLNFGHTIGHAIESTALSKDEDLLHGEAVGKGMMVELKLSTLYGGLDKKEADGYIDKLTEFFGETKYSEQDLKEWIEWASNDKKNESNQLSFSLLERGGKVKNNIQLSPSDVLRIL